MSAPKTCRRECIARQSELVGYVTNQPDGYDKSRPLMSQAICAAPECRKRAEREVREFTREEPMFCHFKDGAA